MQLMSQKPDEISQITLLAFVTRFMERIGDHITNIAENIIFIVSGQRVYFE